MSTPADEFSPAFSAAFDAVDEPGPTPPVVPTGLCYPDSTDWSCAYTAEELAALRADPATAAALARAEALGWYTLASLTAYQIGVCATVVRPCAARCDPAGTWMTAPVRGGRHMVPPVAIGSFSPHLEDGVWVNACSCDRPADCSCTALCEAILPGPVGMVTSVVLDGTQLPRGAYRVDNSNRLVRTDGQCWPACQDLSSSDPYHGLWVTYYRGAAPNPLTEYAAGVLAHEFYLACGNKACRLPAGVTSVTRQGVSYQVVAGSFPGGYTGIHEVDAVIRIFNPYGLTSPPRVVSPDVPRGRQTTWSAS